MRIEIFFFFSLSENPLGGHFIFKIFNFRKHINFTADYMTYGFLSEFPDRFELIVSNYTMSSNNFLRGVPNVVYKNFIWCYI